MSMYVLVCYALLPCVMGDRMSFCVGFANRPEAYLLRRLALWRVCLLLDCGLHVSERPLPCGLRVSEGACLHVMCEGLLIAVSNS